MQKRIFAFGCKAQCTRALMDQGKIEERKLDTLLDKRAEMKAAEEARGIYVQQQMTHEVK